MTYKDPLWELVEKVQDEQTFINFLFAMIRDREDDRRKEETNPSSPYGASVNVWENGSIEAFLEAAAAWAESSIDGLPFHPKTENPWQRAVEIIHAGKFYE